MSRTEPAGHQARLEGADAWTRNRLRRAVQAILWLLMDSPAFPAGHSGLTHTPLRQQPGRCRTDRRAEQARRRAERERERAEQARGCRAGIDPEQE